MSNLIYLIKISVLSSINFGSNKTIEDDTTKNNNNKNKTGMSESEKDEKQKILDDMKNNIKDFTNIFIGNSSEKVDKILKTEIFTIQINTQDPNDAEKNDKKAIEEGISTANFTECEKLLKEKYNISQSTNLLLKKE
jgi:hypothetical protein